MDPSKRKSLSLAEEAQINIETAMKEFYQFSESTLPSALKSSAWCEANVKDAFKQAQSCEYCCAQLPHEILEAQLKLREQCQPFSISGYELSVDFYSKASQMLFLNFFQNPDISLQVLQIVNQEYESLFGVNKLHLMQQKFQHYLNTNDSLTSFLKIECHPAAAIQVEAHIIVEQLKTIPDSYKIKLKIKSMLSTGRNKYARMIVYMLVNDSCTFVNEIVDIFSEIFKNLDGTWNNAKATSIIFYTDKDVLTEACLKQIKNSSDSTSTLLELVYDWLNDISKPAKFVQDTNGNDYEWDIGELGVRFQDFEELLRLFARSEDVLNCLRCLMELKPPHNSFFWDQLLSQC